MGVDTPAFEVRTRDAHFKIWADGRISGFPRGSTLIFNRIPLLLVEERETALRWIEEQQFVRKHNGPV